MISLYQFIALIAFYAGMSIYIKFDSIYIRLPSVITSMFAFEYLLGWFA